MTPIHTLLSEAADLLDGVLPEDAEIRSLTLYARGVPPHLAIEHASWLPALSVQAGESAFRRVAAGHTIEAEAASHGGSQLYHQVGPVRLYCSTSERLDGAVVLDSEGRTVLAPCEGRTA